MKEVGIGIIGFGTVGAGVAECLLNNSNVIAQRSGAKPVLSGIADIDIESDRGVSVDSSILTTDARALIADPATEIVVELVGGTGVARDFTLESLRAGKPVVTANKALLAEHGDEIFAAAAESGTDLYFGASVGGGIPIIRALREGLSANQVHCIRGILNGTCNYILTRMEDDRMAFDDALAEAQENGYAEADPALDIDGIDTAHKAVILASLASGTVLPMESVYVEGIRGMSEMDIEYALDLGYRIKLLAIIRLEEGEVEVRVHPAMIPLKHVLASVSGVYNAVMVGSDFTGDTLYYGRGAGREPTAGTVAGDVVDVMRNIVHDCRGRVPAISLSQTSAKTRSMNAIETKYYLRLSLLDKPGALAGVAAALGEHDISIASALQTETNATGEYVTVVVVTHEAKEENLNAALKKIRDMNTVGAEPVRMRIEE